jgi:hypothetical protein
MNVALMMVLALCIPFLFMGTKGVETFFIFLTAGLAAVAALNYIFFSNLTLWHRD